MIDIKDATQSALDFLKVVYPDNTPANLMLEEVELSKDSKFWLITLGFTRFDRPLGLLSSISPPQTSRVYKTILVDANTGKAESMKIREL